MKVTIGPEQILLWDIQKSAKELDVPLTIDFVDSFYDHDPKNRVCSMKLGPLSRQKRLKKKTVNKILAMLNL